MNTPRITLFAAVAALLFSCDIPATEDPVSGLKIDPSAINFAYEGGEQIVNITATDAWTLESAGADWCRYYPESGKIVVSENLDRNNGRITELTLKSGSLSATLTITQDVNSDNSSFYINKKNVEVPAEGGEFDITVVSEKVDYEITIVAGWITELSRSGNRTTGETIRFKADANPSEKNTRTGIVSVCTKDGSCIPVTVKQITWPKYAHMNIGYRFTATWCGWCPRMNKSVKQAQDDYPDKIQHVAIHGGGSSLDFSGANTLMDQYMIQGFPTGIVDGRIEIDNESIKTTARNIVNAAKETESTYGTSTGASIATTLKGNNLDINMRLFFKVPGDYLVTVLLVEDGIIAQQTDYDEGVTHTSYVHDNVARYAVTPIKGESVAGVEQFSIRDLKWSVTINEGWNADNVRVLAYVQAAYGDRRKISTANYGDFYVDNCFTVQAGKTLELETE